MRKIKTPGSLIALLIAASFSTYAQVEKAAIEKKLASKYTLTQPTGDMTDIVTAGAVLVLQKRGSIMMVPVSSTNLYQNNYKDGKISQNAIGRLARISVPGVSQTDIRVFVPGEKMWLTKIDVKDDGVVFDLFTDAYNDLRYKAALKFKFAKGSTPSPDEVEKLVGEVFQVQPAEDTNASAPPEQPKQKPGAPGGRGQQQASVAGPPAAPPPVAPAPAEPEAVIPPPPPPPVDAPPPAPKTVALGQTPAQVVDSLGQPDGIVKVGAAKQIYQYKDLKVTFVGGKVTAIDVK